jgi:hypothetical protein
MSLQTAYARSGPRRLAFEPGPILGESRAAPARRSIRVPARHQLAAAQSGRCHRDDYRRWERLVPMQLWQLDVMRSVRLADSRRRSCSPVSMITLGMR